MDADQAIRGADQHRVYWHSRRGMLELDLLLMPYASEVYPRLPAIEQDAYRALLDSEDTDLFSWLVARDVPTDCEFAGLIERIIDHARNRSST